MRNRIHTFLRSKLAFVLKLLTKATLRKHKPEVVVITGSDQTSIAREAIYQVLQEKLPARRNMEYVEAEFSIPLTVFNTRGYPKSIPSWILVIIRTVVQLIANKAYKHALVLEISGVEHKGQQAWLDILSPKIAVIVDKSDGDLKLDRSTMVVRIKTGKGKEIEKPHLKAAREIGAYYKIRTSVLDRITKNMKFPAARVRFLKGKNGSLIIDATHHYFPVHLMSILEIANTYEGPKILITESVTDQVLAKTLDDSWQVNPLDIEGKGLSKEHTIVLRGERVKLQEIGREVLDPRWLHK